MRKEEAEYLKWGVNQRKKEEMTELEHLQADNEYLRAENAILKKLRELRLKDEKEQEEKQNCSRISNKVSFRYPSKHYQTCSFNLLLPLKATESSR